MKVNTSFSSQFVLRPIWVLSAILLLSIMVHSCNEDESASPFKVTNRPFLNIAARTATSFALEWDSKPGATGYLIDISSFDDFRELLPDYNSFFVADTVFNFQNLVPNQYYYIRARTTNGEENGIYSEPLEAQLPPLFQNDNFLTDDGVEIHTYTAIPSVQKSKYGAVIFVHDIGEEGQWWVDIRTMHSILKELNLITILVDIRAHGNSGNDQAISSLLTDPNRAPKDLDAVLNQITSNEIIDKTKLGIIGDRFGASLVTAFAHKNPDTFKAIIVFDPIIDHVTALAETSFEDLDLNRIMFMSEDANKGPLEDVFALFEITKSPLGISIHHYLNPQITSPVAAELLNDLGSVHHTRALGVFSGFD